MLGNRTVVLLLAGAAIILCGTLIGSEAGQAILGESPGARAGGLVIAPATGAHAADSVHPVGRATAQQRTGP